MTDIREAIGGAHNVLLLAPAMSRHEGEQCSELLGVASPEDANLLSITLTGAPDDRLDAWQRDLDGGLPDEIAVVSVNEQLRGDATSFPTDSGSSLHVGTVSNPADLTGLGIEVTKHLERWQTNDNETVICFHSLSTLLQYTDLESTFRFLHTLSGRVATIDGRAHYHMDPDVHDDKTVQTLLQLFDAVVRIEDDGIDVRTR